MAKWYAVMNDREDTDWGFGSYNLEEAKAMLKDKESDKAYIAVIEEGNDPICIEELTQDDLFKEDKMSEGDFLQAVEEYGFTSDKVTEMWNRMEKENPEEFESIYAMWTAHKFCETQSALDYMDASDDGTLTEDELEEFTIDQLSVIYPIDNVADAVSRASKIRRDRK